MPNNAFMGSVGVLPGEPEVEKWLKRETDLAAAGRDALPQDTTSARPADVCGPKGSHKDKCLRTIPQENGGNMDVQQMVVGTTLLLPCFIDGCGFFIGDVHYA